MASIPKMLSKWNAWVACAQYTASAAYIYIHLQAMACNRWWLKYESGLSNELYFQTAISLAQA